MGGGDEEENWVLMSKGWEVEEEAFVLFLFFEREHPRAKDTPRCHGSFRTKSFQGFDQPQDQAGWRRGGHWYNNVLRGGC